MPFCQKTQLLLTLPYMCEINFLFVDFWVIAFMFFKLKSIDFSYYIMCVCALTRVLNWSIFVLYSLCPTFELLINILQVWRLSFTLVAHLLGSLQWPKRDTFVSRFSFCWPIFLFFYLSMEFQGSHYECCMPVRNAEFWSDPSL